MTKSQLKAFAYSSFILAFITLIAAPNPFDHITKPGFASYFFCAAILTAIGWVFSSKAKKTQV